MSTQQIYTNEPLVNQNYQVLEEIGEGGYGIIYKARQISTGQIVAIKALKMPQGLKKQKVKQQLARFEREAQLCAEINHPNIVKILDKGYSEQTGPYAVFEYIKGETLKAHILQNKILSATDMSILMGQVLEALAHVHKKGIVHRDLKPHNIMVTQNGTKKYIKILDFGIGTFTHDFNSFDYKSLTTTKEQLGTPSYSAPEQLRGEPATVKSDLYSWGLITIECLTGKAVMDGGSLAEVLQHQLMPAKVPIPPTIVDHPLGNLLNRILEKNPANRIGDADSVLKEFENINFNTLTGSIQESPVKPYILNGDTLTQSTVRNIADGIQKQLTILCLKISLTPLADQNTSLKILDTIQKDLLNHCKDTALRYGGWFSESFMNNLAIYFGYPESCDSDARRAGRTALELVTGMRKRGTLLQQQYGMNLNIQIGIHTGIVLIQNNQPPQGDVPNQAFDLIYKAAPGEVLVSASSKKLLEPFLDFEKADVNQSLLKEKTFKLIGEHRTEALYNWRSDKDPKRMIGRNIEKAVILNIWNNSENKGSAIIISGQAGIGKSRLAHEIKFEIQQQEKKVQECRCYPEHKNNALYPFLTMLRNHWGIAQSEDENKVVAIIRNELEKNGCNVNESLPMLCSWLSIPLPNEYSLSQFSPEEQKAILFKTLKKCILHIDQGSAFLLVLEDLHWLDLTSREFIDYLISDLEGQRYMLLMTTRPEFECPWKNNGLSHINLNALPESSIRLMIQEYLGKNSVEEKVVKYILNRADGIPFFIEELINMLVEQNLIVPVNKVYKLTENVDKHTIPISLQDLLNAKLDNLILAKETAQLAAAIGREFSYELLSKSSLKDEETLQNDMNLLTENDLVYHQRNVHGNIYIFKHALVRDAAYESMLPQLRKEVHSYIAEALREFFPKRIEKNPFEIACHLSEAKKFNDAIEFGLKHVEKLVSKSQNHETLAVIQKIKQWINGVEDEVEKKCFRLRLNDVLIPVYLNTEGYGTPKFVHIYKENTEAIDFLKSHKKEKLVQQFENILLKSECLYLNHLHGSNQREKARQFAKPVLKKLENLKESNLRIYIRACIGQMNLFEGNFEDAEELLMAVLEEGYKLNKKNLFHSLGFDPIAMTHGNLASLYTILGDYSKVTEHLEKGLTYAEKVNNSVDIVTSYIFKSLLMGLFGEKEKVKQALEELKLKYEDIIKDCWISSLLVFMEDWVNGKTENSVRVRQQYIDTKQNSILTWYEMLLADTYINNKQFREAYEIMKEAKERNQESNEVCLLPKVYNLLAISLFHLSGKITDEARNYLQEAIRIAREQNNKWFELNIKYNYIKISGTGEKNEEIPSLISSVKELASHFENDNTAINSIKSYLKTKHKEK